LFHFPQFRQSDGIVTDDRCCKRASARHITAVIPTGWASDRKDKPRVPIGAKINSQINRNAGATRVMTMDLHADQIQGFLKTS
jgi:ribose-phosphate pyrophosphokinase